MRISPLPGLSPALSLALSLAASLLLAACGGGDTHSQTPRPPTIEELRARAAARPADAEAQLRVAEAELLMEGGEAERARPAIERALALAEGDPRPLFLAALERELHGEIAAALERYLAVIEAAQRSDRPEAGALAEVAVSAVNLLNDGVGGYRERVGTVFGVAHGAPGHIGPAARYAIGDLLIDLAYREGDMARVHALQASQSCVHQWRVIGPFGPRHWLGFDRAFGPEEEGRIGRDRYDLGPGRGEREVREVEARGCMGFLGGGPIGGPGTSYAEATLRAPRAGRYLLRVETPNPVQVFLDGQPFVRIDRRRELGARVGLHPVELSAGEHRVLVKVTTTHVNPILLVALVNLDGTAPSEESSATDFSDEEPPADTPLNRYLRVARRMVRGDFVGADEAVRDLAAPEGATPSVLIAAAAARLSNPLNGEQARRDEARELLVRAAEGDERAWYPRLQLARFEAGEGREVEAIGMLREARGQWPEVLSVPLYLNEWLSHRGWDAEAREAAEAALAVSPDACWPRRALLSDALGMHRSEEADRHAEALVACDARSQARLNQLVGQRRWAQASAELERLAALEPESSPVAILRTRQRLARAQGQEAEVRRLLSELEGLMAQSQDLAEERADLLLAAGDRAGALRALSERIDGDPQAFAALHRLRRAIGGEHPLEAFRRDGLQAIRDLEASSRRYDQPDVLVLDYTVIRVFEDGSMLELTHNIHHLQSQEAVDRHGEFQVPDESHLLTLRTVKASGELLEPDEIAGKDTISLPNLAVGDYIEFEYVQAHPAPSGYPEGALGYRFYFQSFEVPFDHSQLTVIVPASFELSYDPRGPAPRREESVEGGLRVIRWTARESRPLREEPNSVANREFLPSVYWGYRATWPQYIESIRDSLADRDIRSPAALRLVHEILGGERRLTAEQKARRIYGWVLEHVEEAEGGVFGSAPSMLDARTGHRGRIIRYLLSLAGVRAELALARSLGSDQTRSEIPDDDTYQHLLIVAHTEEGPIWIYGGDRGAPFGYIPAPLRGQDALMLTEEATRVEVPDAGVEADLRSVEAEVELRRGGAATLRVTEVYQGAGAANWRRNLERIPAAQLENAFQQSYVARMVAGGRLSSLRITGREDREMPLTLRYEVEVDRFGREDGSGRWILPELFPTSLGRGQAQVSSRTTTQIIAGAAFDFTLHLRLPEGVTPPRPPEDRQLRLLDGGSVTQESQAEAHGLTLRRSVRLPWTRVSPESYPAFARSCRASDELEHEQIAVDL